MLVVKIKENLDAGVEKLRNMAGIFSERLKVEAAVIKLIQQIGDLEKRRASLLKSVGERVFEIRNRAEANVYEDSNIRMTLAEVEKLDAEIRAIKDRASAIGKVE